MTTMVCYWKANDDSRMGHISMWVNYYDLSKRFYISWWPSSDIGLRRCSGHGRRVPHNGRRFTARVRMTTLQSGVVSVCF